MTGPAPMVRVVVVNFNAGARLAKCIRAVVATRWPADRLEVVVVDNASSDRSADGLEEIAENVRVLRSPANLGFAGGSNFGMRDLAGVDFVALVNNDAFVEPGWLEELVAAFDEPDVGAACPKILFEPVYAEVRIEAPEFQPGPHDGRSLGVRISGVRSRGVEQWKATRFLDGAFGEERPADAPVFRWLGPTATLWLPLPSGTTRATGVKLRLEAERDKSITVVSSAGSSELDVKETPDWYDVPVSPPYFDVINNAGSALVEGGFGSDRGFLQRDQGQFDHPTDVFAWCGAAVLLSSAYLEDVGVFDDEYFLYYEDFDLSWRGQLLGWRYRYAPTSVVRHIHSASTVEGSVLFDHYVQRNRLLTLLKNAPSRYFVERLAAYVRETGHIVAEEAVRPTLRRQPRRIDYSRRRFGSTLSFLRHVPGALRKRKELGQRRTVGRDELLARTVPGVTATQASNVTN